MFDLRMLLRLSRAMDFDAEGKGLQKLAEFCQKTQVDFQVNLYFEITKIEIKKIFSGAEATALPDR